MQASFLLVYSAFNTSMQNFKDGHIPVPDNKVISLRNYALKSLAAIYTGDELENIADWLIEHFAGYNKTQWINNPQVLVNQSAIIHFSNAIDKLLTGVPVQYVIGEVEFYHLQLLVSPGGLIPRPETEELVDIIVKENKQRKGLRILDIGTGSGCIALALAKHLPGCTVTAVDISEVALEIARKNAQKNAITNIGFIQADVLNQLNLKENIFDIIVSNPPYIAAVESANMSTNVLEHEPHMALFVPDEDPLVFYKAIVKMAPQSLLPQGKIYVEINERLGEDTAAVFTPEIFSSVHLLTDLFGKHRFIKAEKL